MTFHETTQKKVLEYLRLRLLAKKCGKQPPSGRPFQNQPSPCLSRSGRERPGQAPLGPRRSHCSGRDTCITFSLRLCCRRSLSGARCPTFSCRTRCSTPTPKRRTEARHARTLLRGARRVQRVAAALYKRIVAHSLRADYDMRVLRNNTGGILKYKHAMVWGLTPTAQQRYLARGGTSLADAYNSGAELILTVQHVKLFARRKLL